MIMITIMIRELRSPPGSSVVTVAVIADRRPHELSPRELILRYANRAHTIPEIRVRSRAEARAWRFVFVPPSSGRFPDGSTKFRRMR